MPCKLNHRKLNDHEWASKSITFINTKMFYKHKQKYFMVISNVILRSCHKMHVDMKFIRVHVKEMNK